MVEEWLPVLGFEGLYEVSSMGRVASVEKRVFVPANRIAKDHIKHMKHRILKPATNKTGHKHVILYEVGGRVKHMKRVHRLVMEAFVGPCPEGMECCHNNGIPSDNALSNLRWGSREENWDDRKRHQRGFA